MSLQLNKEKEEKKTVCISRFSPIRVLESAFERDFPFFYPWSADVLIVIVKLIKFRVGWTIYTEKLFAFGITQ